MSKRSLEDIERATVERLDASPVKIHKSEAAQDGKALDVLVVGAGPTGLFLANDLARRLSQNNGRTKVRVIDGAKGPSTHSKALAVQVRTMELYDDLGHIPPRHEGAEAARASQRAVAAAVRKAFPRTPLLATIGMQRPVTGI